MIWDYYSSVILYFRSEFAKSYTIKFSTAIVPSKFAELVQSVEIISEKQTIQKADKEHDALKEEPLIR